MKLGVVSLGCDKATVDSERIVGELVGHGATVEPELGTADVVLVNTCGFIDAAKRESIEALRAVIVAARQTQAYVRRLEDTGRQDHAEEARLAELWTELGFRLGDLKLDRLAKRCDIRCRPTSALRRNSASKRAGSAQ